MGRLDCDWQMISQSLFEQRHQSDWDDLALILAQLENARRDPVDKRFLMRFPSLYRQVCGHYALARDRRYAPSLVNQLHDLVQSSHRRLYQHRGAWLWRLFTFITSDFPKTLRHQVKYLYISIALFLLPGVLTGLLCYQQPTLIYSVLGQEEVASLEWMYNPDNSKIGRDKERGSETDFVMFGYYIYNNIGIGFRTFAGGMLLGLGTLLLLLFNGVVIGSAAGHLTRMGYSETFWPFVSGHGAFELTAIVICGAAGLMLGRALIAPGQQRRTQALTSIAPDAVKLVMGAAAMLLVAAFIEAFWSSSVFIPTVKYTIAALLWILVAIYLIFAGRQ